MSYQVVDPFTEQQIRAFKTISDAELDNAIGEVYASFREWSATAVEDRAKCLRRVAELHRERKHELAAVVVQEMGKPLAAALDEVDFSASIYDYYADNAETFTADEPVDLLSGEGSAVIRRSPLGVILGIMPWNFPIYQVARFASANLLVGNTLVVKHAPQCPDSADRLEKIFQAAGLPQAAYRNVYASNEQIEKVIADPRVRGVSLTGSERAGAAVAEIAGRNLKKVVLELGGSDPFIVLSTDDVDGVVAAAVDTRLYNNGQTCNAGKRFIVIEQLYDEFVQKFTERLFEVTLGDPRAKDTVVGPLSSRAAADRLDSQVRKTIAQGARVAIGGRRDGNFYEPTVLVDVDEHNDGYREEFFGPVAQVFKAVDEADAVRIANDTDFGLGSYVFTVDREQALRVADALEAGMVFINAVGADTVELPFGGVKRSGFGRELGSAGPAEFVNKKMIRLQGFA